MVSNRDLHARVRWRGVAAASTETTVAAEENCLAPHSSLLHRPGSSCLVLSLVVCAGKRCLTFSGHGAGQVCRRTPHVYSFRPRAPGNLKENGNPNG